MPLLFHKTKFRDFAKLRHISVVSFLLCSEKSFILSFFLCYMHFYPVVLVLHWHLNLALVIINFPDLNGNTWKVKKLKYLGHA